MTDPADRLNVVKGLRYRSDGVVDDFTADVEVDGMSLGIHQQDDIISLDADEARALRDWLNKVLPMTDNSKEAIRNLVRSITQWRHGGKAITQGDLDLCYAFDQFIAASKDEPELLVLLLDANCHQESDKCWCGPTLDYVDPETGAEVWVHHKAN